MTCQFTNHGEPGQQTWRGSGGIYLRSWKSQAGTSAKTGWGPLIAKTRTSTENHLSREFRCFYTHVHWQCLRNKKNKNSPLAAIADLSWELEAASWEVSYFQVNIGQACIRRLKSISRVVGKSHAQFTWLKFTPGSRKPRRSKPQCGKAWHKGTTATYVIVRLLVVESAFVSWPKIEKLLGSPLKSARWCYTVVCVVEAYRRQTRTAPCYLDLRCRSSKPEKTSLRQNWSAPSSGWSSFSKRGLSSLCLGRAAKCTRMEEWGCPVFQWWQARQQVLRVGYKVWCQLERRRRCAAWLGLDRFSFKCW